MLKRIEIYKKSWKNKLKEHITDNYSGNTIQIPSLRAEAENKFISFT